MGGSRCGSVVAHWWLANPHTRAHSLTHTQVMFSKHVYFPAHTHTHTHAHTQVVYSEPMAVLRVRTLLAVGRPADAANACGVHYEAPGAVNAAPWRLWLTLQALYHQGELQVCGCVYARVRFCLGGGGQRVWCAL